MKRTPLRKKSKQRISVLQRKLWEYCKEIIRKKYGPTCYVCDRGPLEGSNWHTAHLIPKAACGASLKYDLRNLRPSCYNCNINLGGNGAEFLRKMIIREGQAYVDGIYEDRNKVIKAYDHYEMLLTKYELMLEGM